MGNLLDSMQVGPVSTQPSGGGKIKLITIPVDKNGCGITYAVSEEKADEFISQRAKKQKRKKAAMWSIVGILTAAGAIVGKFVNIRGLKLGLVLGTLLGFGAGGIGACISEAISNKKIDKHAKEFAKENA